MRSFSALHRLKVYLRSTISEDRLNGLALLNVHRNIKIDLTEAVDQFAHAHPRTATSCTCMYTMVYAVFDYDKMF